MAGTELGELTALMKQGDLLSHNSLLALLLEQHSYMLPIAQGKIII